MNLNRKFWEAPSNLQNGYLQKETPKKEELVYVKKGNVLEVYSK